MFSLRKEKSETFVSTNLLGMYFGKYIAFLMVDWFYYILCLYIFYKIRGEFYVFLRNITWQI